MPGSISPRAQKCLLPKPVTAAQELLNIVCAAGSGHTMARGLCSSSSRGKEQEENIAGMVFIKQINRLGGNEESVGTSHFLQR